MQMDSISPPHCQSVVIEAETSVSAEKWMSLTEPSTAVSVVHG